MPEVNGGNRVEIEESELRGLVSKVVNEALKAGAEGKDPLKAIEGFASSAERVENFFGDSQEGLGYCIDERAPNGIVEGETFTRVEPTNTEAFRDRNLLRPGFPGGFLGVVAMLMLAGKSYEDALEGALEIYRSLGWEIEGHTDDDHGHITNPEELVQRRKGCGFGGVVDRVMHRVAEIAKEAGIEGVVRPTEELKSEDALNRMLDNGGRIVVLTGDHYSNANLLLNGREGRTLNRVAALEAEKPTFVADVWAVAQQQFVNAFNRVAQVNWTPNLLKALGTAMTLITAEELNALRVEEGKLANVLVAP